MSKSVISVIVLLLILERLAETYLPDKVKKRGKVSANWLFYSLLISGILVYVSGIAEYVFVVKKINTAVSIVGLLLVTIKIMLKFWSIKTLGKLWSIQIEIRKDHELIKGGPYRYVRHPSYLSTIIEVFGGLLVVNAYYSIILTCFLYVPLIIIRIVLEERQLLIKFGERYIEYSCEVPMLLPFKMFIRKRSENDVL